MSQCWLDKLVKPLSPPTGRVLHVMYYSIAVGKCFAWKQASLDSRVLALLERLRPVGIDGHVHAELHRAQCPLAQAQERARIELRPSSQQG